MAAMAAGFMFIVCGIFAILAIIVLAFISLIGCMIFIPVTMCLMICILFLAAISSVLCVIASVAGLYIFVAIAQSVIVGGGGSVEMLLGTIYGALQTCWSAMF
jgi:hypothetical protein